ncbi:MAG: hypothetical protein M1840_005215 [Geoglossum simile]|nr:MAG: hypothetical protein M1840_005215 [Geoglossum simile]
MFFRTLNGKPIDTFNQGLKANINTAFVFCFNSSLAAALALAYTQRLWYLFRSKPLKAATIDRLFSILRNPANLASFAVIRHASLEWFFALLCWCVPLATIIPTGALIVSSDKAFTKYGNFEMGTANVKSYNASFRGNGSYGDLLDWQLARLDADHLYLSPKRELIRAVDQVLLSGQIIPWESPCGQNCSYSLNFNGPSYQCSEESGPQFDIDDPREIQYKAEEAIRYRQSVSLPLSILVNCTNSGVPNCSGTLSIRCIPYYSKYNIIVRYVNGVRDISSNVTRIEELLGYHQGNFYKQKQGSLGPMALNVTVGDDWYMNQEDMQVSYTLPRSNAFAIKDALISRLVGQVSELGHEGETVNSTWPRDPCLMVLESALSQYNLYGANKWVLNMSARALEELTHNVSISVISLDRGQWSTKVSTIKTPWINVYQFVTPRNVILSYASALLLGLIIIAMSLLALRKNGVTAADGFLQILTTTNGSTAVDNAIAGGCIGGERNFPKELKDLELVYGEIKGGRKFEGDEWSARWAGFGTRSEVAPLTVGEEYGRPG